MRYMLDTNICIYCINKRPRGTLDNFLAHNIDDICVSSITYAELFYGAEKSDYQLESKLAILRFFRDIEICDFDTGAAIKYGEIKSDLERKGTPIGPNDTFIAAHAASLGCVLITNNEREFNRVDGLMVENWAK